ncbi:MAG TPA: DoxX family protein [Pseudonocardia sp.]|jgi:hypothetical protein
MLTTRRTRTQSDDTDAGSRPVQSKAHSRAGVVITTLVVLFLLFDSVTKLLQLEMVTVATRQLGFPDYAVLVMGVSLLVSLVLYLVPRTAIFGAILVTAYLGGAVCANLRADLPLFGYILSPVYVAVLMWAGFYLRSPRLRELVHAGH